MEPHDLLLDTAVTPDPLRPNVYRANLPDAWSFLTPSGGVLSSVALRAMEAALADDSMRLTSATAIFCEPVRAGPLVMTVHTLRRGNAAAQLRVSLQEGSEPRSDRGPGLEVVATFSKKREGPNVTEAQMPVVKSWAEAEPSGERRFQVRFFDNFEDRLALGHLSYEKDWVMGPARYARWVRYLITPRAADGSLSLFALPPLADLMPPSLLQRLGPDHPRFLAPSLDLTIHFLESTHSDRILVSAYCRRALDGFASAEVELYDDTGRLLAYGSQVMLIRRWPNS